MNIPLRELKHFAVAPFFVFISAFSEDSAAKTMPTSPGNARRSKRGLGIWINVGAVITPPWFSHTLVRRLPRGNGA
jgi:hypothetical protein